MKISVVCPVYNSVNLLGRAINSVIDQSYFDWELILVDDGSTDGSGELCDSFSLKDKRIFAIHQQNQGQFEARRTGVLASKGDYILFLDSDDAFVKNAFSLIINRICSYDAMLYNAYIFCNSIKQKQLPCVDENSVIYDEDISRYALGNNIFGYLWMYCIKRSIVEDVLKNEIFGNRINYTEDLLLISLFLKKIKSLVLVKDYLYSYFVTDSGISSNISFSEKQDRFFVFNEVFGGSSILLSKETKETICWAIISYLTASATVNDDNTYKTSFKIVKKSKIYEKVLKRNKYNSRFLNYCIILLRYNLRFLLKILLKKHC